MTTDTNRPTRSKPTARANRPERVPLSEQRTALHLAEDDKDPNFKYRWVNDVPGRIYKMQKAGWEFVKDVYGKESGVDAESKHGSVVCKNVGKEVTAYLMRIDRDWFEEDKKKFNDNIDKSEASMKQNLNSGKDGTYGKVEIN